MPAFKSSTGHPWAAGHFLVNDEECIRETMTFSADTTGIGGGLTLITRDDGRTVVPAGSVYATKNGDTTTPLGIVYEDIDVTDGNTSGSVVTEGTVYVQFLVGVQPSAISTLATQLPRIKFVNNMGVIRPYEDEFED